MKRGANDERFTGLTTVVSLLGFVLFVPPLLSAFDRGARVWNVPVVWLYVFGAWALVIGLVAILVRRSG